MRMLKISVRCAVSGSIWLIPDDEMNLSRSDSSCTPTEALYGIPLLGSPSQMSRSAHDKPRVFYINGVSDVTGGRGIERSTH